MDDPLASAFAVPMARDICKITATDMYKLYPSTRGIS